MVVTIRFDLNAISFMQLLVVRRVGITALIWLGPKVVWSFLQHHPGFLRQRWNKNINPCPPHLHFFISNSDLHKTGRSGCTTYRHKKYVSYGVKIVASQLFPPNLWSDCMFQRFKVLFILHIVTSTMLGTCLIHVCSLNKSSGLILNRSLVGNNYSHLLHRSQPWRHSHLQRETTTHTHTKKKHTHHPLKEKKK